jgi:hypothetical protein
MTSSLPPKRGDKPVSPALPSALAVAVWSDDLPTVKRLLAEGADINELTPAGDSLFHLAVCASELRSGGGGGVMQLRMGHLDVAEELVAGGINMLIRDSDHTPSLLLVAMFADAERGFARKCCKAFDAQSSAEVATRLQHLRTILPSLPNFRLQFTFAFQSWIPFVSRFLPSDTCILRKVWAAPGL